MLDVQVARMDRSKQEGAALMGDVLRACTCTNFVYQTTALFGAKAPNRTIVLYGADKQKWSKVTFSLGIWLAVAQLSPISLPSKNMRCMPSNFYINFTHELISRLDNYESYLWLACVGLHFEGCSLWHRSSMH